MNVREYEKLVRIENKLDLLIKMLKEKNKDLTGRKEKQPLQRLSMNNFSTWAVGKYDTND